MKRAGRLEGGKAREGEAIEQIESWLMRLPLVILLLVALGGCTLSHDFYLMGRQTGVTGTATVPANGHRGGPIEIMLAGKPYRGQWAYMEIGGAVGIGMASAYGGGQTATATGVFAGLPTGGNGTVLAAASDGSTLRCTFNFSEWNLKGIGVCQDNRGETYDLQIH
jgi:hypothetical protein